LLGFCDVRNNTGDLPSGTQPLITWRVSRPPIPSDFIPLFSGFLQVVWRLVTIVNKCPYFASFPTDLKLYLCYR